jgi:Flp pilus assembly pilin Flp
MLSRFWIKSAKGATAIEYAFIAAGIAMAIAAVVFVVGGNLEAFFGILPDKMSGS